MKKQSGFATLEVVLLVVVVGVLAFTGVSYYNNTHPAADPSGSTIAKATVPTAPQVSTTADLTTAENAVDQMDIDASTVDSAQLDTELANF